jgi:hypothetical protein
MIMVAVLAEDLKTGDVEAFKLALERDGFTVQEGELGFLDLIKLYDLGVFPSVYGNNPSTKYLTYFVPPAPGCTIPEPFAKIAQSLGISQNMTAIWNIRPDEAIVFVGRTPPDCRYFNFDSNLVFRTYGDETRCLWANIGDPLNMAGIKTEGTPYGSPGNPFNQTTIVITTADKGIDQRIRTAAQSAGFSDGITNTQVLPLSMLNLGIDSDSDAFGLGIRPSLYKDQQIGEEYLNNTPAIVLRITPTKATVLDPYDFPILRVRGTGTTEFDLTDDVEELRKAILDKYSNLSATELPTSIWADDGIDAIQRGIDVFSPCRDSGILWTANQSLSSPTPPFSDLTQYYDYLRDPVVTLGNETDEFIIVYGVNHVATGKGTYSSFAMYGADVWNGVGAITDADFAGSASQYVPGNSDARYLYAYKLTRSCSDDSYCYEVPYGVGGYGIELKQPLFLGFRIYMENATKTAPSYSEIVYDRAIKFDPADK